MINATIVKLLKIAIKNIDEGSPSGAREILEALTSEPEKTGSENSIDTALLRWFQEYSKMEIDGPAYRALTMVVSSLIINELHRRFPSFEEAYDTLPTTNLTFEGGARAMYECLFEKLRG